VMNGDGSARHVVARAGYGYEVGSPRWSPDGNRLAYAYRAADEEGQSDVRVVNGDGSGARRLGPGREPRWSPSGDRLSVIRGNDVWTIAADGSDGRRLTRDAKRDTGAAEWSPDGSRLAVGRSGRLYLLAADGSNATPIGVGTDPRWSPSGERIAFELDEDVAVADAAGKGVRRLGQGAHPAWSPDGAKVAFDDPWEASWGLSVAPAAGGSVKRISPAGVYAGSPSWSADGRTIAFGFPEGGTGSELERHAAGIYSVVPDGTALTRLVPADRSGLRLRDIRAGGRTRKLFVPGDGEALGLSPTLFAVLGRRPRGGPTRLDVYRQSSVTLVASTAVPRSTVRELAMSSSGIVVFRVGREIRAFDPLTRVVRPIARVQSPPIDLSISGRRLAWAENRGPRSIVRAVVLPARLR
jgi:dipeptidyl aminopeptidase/acylaminoacyl peptidase